MSFSANAPFIHWRKIVFGDTDPAGIVYTPRFSDYCMEAVEVWLDEQIGVNWADMNINEGRGTPVINMELTFFAPVRANDKLGVAVRIDAISRSTVTVLLEGLAQGRDQEAPKNVFKARFVFCFTGSDKKSEAIPEINRQRLEAYKEATS